MRILFSTKLFTLFLLFAAIQVNAQSQSMSLDRLQSIKVNELSDQQITQAWNKIQELGVTEQEAYKLLEERGMDPIEVNLFKQRVGILGLNRKGTNLGSIQKKNDIDYSRDTLNVVSKPLIIPNLNKTNIFGSDFFNQSNLKFDPNFSVATPKGYVLGPEDELIILLTGVNETSVRTKISPEGNLQIPYAGIVYLNGFTIEQATAIIKSKMGKIYPALSNGNTKLSVNLGNTRTIKVTIVGEVKTPGTYTLSSLSTFFNALYYSGGPSINGSLRYIELIRNNRVFKTVDFYTFLQKGLLEGNIRLEDQDLISFPVYKKRVSISGEVKRQAIFELKETETLEQLIEYAGGFTDIAYKGIAKIDQVNATERELKDVPFNLFSNFVPKNGDFINFGSIQNQYSNRIILEGAVNRPGAYELSPGLSLSKLIKNADGLKQEAYLERGYIKRTLPNLEKEFISFSPSEIINGKKDIPLLKEDSVVIQNRSDFISNQYIKISGNVRSPGNYLFRKGIKIRDLISMAGGLNEQAAGHNIEISRIIKNNSDSVANKLVETFSINIVDNNNEADNIELEPLDFINVPRLVNYKPLGNISISGEVLFPGNYALQKRDETALDFLKRAGGISPYGSLESTQIFRNGIRVDLDLTKSQYQNENIKTMALMPGDSIYVPRAVSYVQVIGSVNNPQYISFQGRRFKYYINSAGGTLEDARINGSFVKYANGLNKPVRNFLFFRSFPAIKPGSTIIVPKQNPNMKLKVGFAEISGITSAVTALIGLIAILNR
jgi:protein involved in polysaccharide export with SLBB domain